MLNGVELKDIPALLPKMSLREQEQLLAELDKLEELRAREAAQKKFMPFVKAMWPGFVGGRHHAVMAEAFERVAAGTLKRLIICMPPRHTKSEFASYLLPAWFLGNHPSKKIIQASHTAELAVGFGRKVRNLVDTERYANVFPDLKLQADSKAAGRWNTSAGGDYFAIGISGAVTGKGADCVYFSCTVLTKRGSLPIADVRVGDFVYGYDHTTEQCKWTRVRAVSTQLKPELVELSGVLVTPEHRVFTRTGYRPASTVCNVAVPKMRSGVSASTQRTSTGLPQVRQSQRCEGVLFKSVFPQPGPGGAAVRMWGEESSGGANLQNLLPSGQAREVKLRGVWDSILAHCRRSGAKPAQARRAGKRVLLPSVLRCLQGKTRGPSVASNRPMQKVRQAGTADKKILRCGLLLYAQGFEHRVFRYLVKAQARSEVARQRCVRVLRTVAPTYFCASHRPRRDKQRATKLGYAVRRVPQPLSSSDVGTSAGALAKLLSGEGYRVVDIQTGTGNFFVAPPETNNFFGSAVLAHNCLIIDDPHSEQEAALAEVNPEIYDKTYEWFTSGPRQRLQPGGAIIIVQTRWSKRDLVGRVLEAAAQRGGEDWEVIEFPAILPSGKPTWPEFWPLAELQALKEELPNSKWQAQYQQQPTSDTSAIIKREWWQRWPKDDPPTIEFTLQSWDTAFEKSQRSDYSALTTWGVFYRDDPDTGTRQANIILLNAFRERMEFPRLKQKALQEYKEWEPDSVIIEKKASGAPLVYELRAMGIPVQSFTPTKGNDKISRLNAVSDLFASGRVWAPNTSWAEEVIEEVASFPAGSHDDFVDSTSQALHRFRQGGYLTVDLDEPEEVRYFKSNRNQGYY